MTIRRGLAAVNAAAITLKNEAHECFRQIYTFARCDALVRVMVKWRTIGLPLNLSKQKGFCRTEEKKKYSMMTEIHHFTKRKTRSIFCFYDQCWSMLDVSCCSFIAGYLTFDIFKANSTDTELLLQGPTLNQSAATAESSFEIANNSKPSMASSTTSSCCEMIQIEISYTQT